MSTRKFFALLAILAVMFAPAFSAQAAGNIDSTNKYSQFYNADLDSDGTNDFINWSPTNGGATVTDSAVTGYIWGETVGWINLNPTSAHVTNNCSGTLGGYAWGQNTGWINFSPSAVVNTPNQPKINTSTGRITGAVWSQNYGYINLSSPDVGHPGLYTTWRGCATPPAGGSSGGTASGGCNLPYVLINGICQIPQNPTGPTVTTTPPNPTTPPKSVTPSNPNPGTPSNPGTPGGSSGGNPLPPVAVNPTTPPPSYVPPSKVLSGAQGGPIPLIPVENFVSGILGGKPFSYAWLAPILGLLGLLGSIPGLITRFGNIILTIVFGRKRQRGIVYDAKTKQPLDPAYVSVIDVATGKEVVNQITDINGRYGFVLKPGTYRMTAGKTHYAFPSALLAGKDKDEAYENLYFGDAFTVTDEKQIVVFNIPMDPLAGDWNQEEKERLNLIKALVKTPKWFIVLTDILFVVGFVASLAITYFYPVWWNIVMCIIYVAIIVVNVLGYGPVYAGEIRRFKAPVPNGIVRAYNANLNKEIAHTVTTENGGYYMLVPKADYYVTVDAKNPDGTYSRIGSSVPFTAKGGVINHMFDF